MRVVPRLLIISLLATFPLTPSAGAAAEMFTLARPELACAHSGFLGEADGPSGELAIGTDGTLAVSGAGLFTLGLDGTTACASASGFLPFVGGKPDKSFNDGRDLAGDVAFAPNGSVLVANFWD